MGRVESFDKKYIKSLYVGKKPTPILLGSRQGLITFYKGQLKKFVSIGIGNKTENNVTVTNELIEITIKRLKELQVSLRHKPIGLIG